MELLEKTVRYLDEQELKLATAESCTAGLVVSELSRIPGAGQVLDCGLAVYSPESKNRYLKVSFDTIDEHGLTSEAVAREMGLGALNNNNADVAVANTGLAGPGGGDDGTPVGTVCLSWVFRVGGQPVCFCETRRFDGDRNQVRLAAAHYTLERLPHYHRRARDTSD